ncbi:NAD(+)/NADH kinase [Natrialbaceae archaeon AArc-T1-2]|uniref:NAD(+)/NADH kinase n=1 Tax=Natrialbaceae archaeon AArc-T1-2 TaxID=3053904 RepID=UPI00255A7A7B|nr:NAD(+)/NADH kinase [Natrialbaceae archaeon AArc-T1-2]WIV68113.1 NAD(+)/NADH kinase [Natrialbaceae archaeon AArc-T1-2]
MGVEVGIVAKRDTERAQELAATLLEALSTDEVTVTVDDETGAAIDASSAPVAAMKTADLVVSIGGDGTFLFVAREAGDAPLVGVNLGEVGFLNAVSPEEAVDAVTSLVDVLRTTGELETTTVDRITARGDGWELEPALNEVVVHGPRRGHGGGAEIDVRVDGESYARSHADGILVATPTGSTAYNLSEGGPLVYPAADALVVTQMCAEDAMPPLVIDDDSEIELRVAGAETAWAISDGRNRRALEVPTTVTVTVADDPVTIAGPRTNFFEALEKLE